MKLVKSEEIATGISEELKYLKYVKNIIEWPLEKNLNDTYKMISNKIQEEMKKTKELIETDKINVGDCVSCKGNFIKTKNNDIEMDIAYLYIAENKRTREFYIIDLFSGEVKFTAENLDKIRDVISTMFTDVTIETRSVKFVENRD